MSRLVDLELSEVSLVDVPANPGARLLLRKAMDPLEALMQAARNHITNHITKGETREAVAMAKAGTAAPKSFWLGALDAIGKGIAPGVAIDPGMRRSLALQTTDGQLLMRAMHRATS